MQEEAAVAGWSGGGFGGSAAHGGGGDEEADASAGELRCALGMVERIIAALDSLFYHPLLKQPTPEAVSAADMLNKSARAARERLGELDAARWADGELLAGQLGEQVEVGVDRHLHSVAARAHVASRALGGKQRRRRVVGVGLAPSAPASLVAAAAHRSCACLLLAAAAAAAPAAIAAARRRRASQVCRLPAVWLSGTAKHMCTICSVLLWGGGGRGAGSCSGCGTDLGYRDGGARTELVALAGVGGAIGL